jgi:predicted SnoaL-like aldol condensation-catalyzing enzyme
MSTEKNKQIVQNAFLGYLETQDAAALRTIFAKDFVNHGGDGTVAKSGVEGLISHAGKMAAANEPPSIKLEQISAVEDRVFVRWHMCAFHEPTSKRLEWRTHAELRLKDGLVVERWGATSAPI